MSEYPIIPFLFFFILSQSKYGKISDAKSPPIVAIMSETLSSSNKLLISCALSIADADDNPFFDKTYCPSFIKNPSLINHSIPLLYLSGNNAGAGADGVTIPIVFLCSNFFSICVVLHLSVYQY